MNRKVYIVDNGISDVKAITMTQLAKKSKGTPVVEAVTSADKTFITLRTDIVEGRILAGAKLSELPPQIRHLLHCVRILLKVVY